MNEIDQAPSPYSKSVQKRASEALRDLGEQLTGCDAGTLDKCELPPELLAALQEYRRLPPKHGALRRQLQFIGKLMRKLDEETLARIDAQLHRNVDLEKKRFHALEQLRDRLLGGDKAALEELVMAHPAASQPLRQLIRAARKEAEQQKPPASARKLFKLLRALQEGETAGAADDSGAD